MRLALRFARPRAAQVFAQIVAAASDSRAWYTCPNGHRYSIGNCGKAMTKARCIECGAEIGGQSHKLNSDNRALGYESFPTDQPLAIAYTYAWFLFVPTRCCPPS